jgi:transposase
MKAYSFDFRKKIVEVYATENISQRKLAQRFHVALSFIEKLLKQWRETGNLAPKPHGGGNSPKLNAEQRALVQSLIEAKNDITLDELCQEVQQQTRVVVSRATMGRVVQKLNLTRKKRSMPLKRMLHGCNRPGVTTGMLSETFPQKI